LELRALTWYQRLGVRLVEGWCWCAVSSMEST
jgi:hypothetical protein